MNLNISDELVKYILICICQIKFIFENEDNDDLIDDILLTDIIKKNKDEFKTYKKISQLFQKTGKIWEIMIGNFESYAKIDSKVNKSGLDIINIKEKQIFELKNRYNTCNSSSKDKCYSKLSKFKKENSDYEVYFAYINVKNENDNVDKKIIYEDSEIRILSGKKLLKHIFNEDYMIIIDTVQKIIGFFLKNGTQKINDIKINNSNLTDLINIYNINISKK